ncbi:hypothetical protein SAMN05216436_10342 [bacterium A37T11]|nr:hypothetical protein SAMN05216436_10342 [bacterium A37T11]
MVSKIKYVRVQKLDWMRNTLIEASDFDMEAISNQEEFGFFLLEEEGITELTAFCHTALARNEAPFYSTVILPTETDKVLLLYFKGRTAVIAFQEENTAILSVLLAMNQVLAPDYEIRYWRKHPPSSYPMFFPLKMDEWECLETQYGTETIDDLFEHLNEHTRIRFLE